MNRLSCRSRCQEQLGRLRKAAIFDGNATALVCGDVSVSRRELVDRVARLASVPRVCGLTAGSRAAMLAANSHRYVEFYFAVLWAGGVVIPVNSRFALPEMVEQVRDPSPTILIADQTFAEAGQQLAEAASLIKALLLIKGGSASGCAIE